MTPEIKLPEEAETGIGLIIFGIVMAIGSIFGLIYGIKGTYNFVSSAYQEHMDAYVSDKIIECSGYWNTSLILFFTIEAGEKYEKTKNAEELECYRKLRK
jgi:hypothetical protein